MTACLVLLAALAAAPNVHIADVPPVRAVVPGVAGDVASRVPLHYQLDSVHENTHYANSWVRNWATEKFGCPWNAAYVLNGKAYIFAEPQRTTLGQVAAAVPPNQRGRVYNLYLQQQQRWWNDRPLVLLDELAGYTNSMEASRQTGKYDVAFQEEIVREFLIYGEVLVNLLRTTEPGYDTTGIRAYLRHQATRLQPPPPSRKVRLVLPKRRS